MTPKTSKRYNSEWPEVKMFFNLDLFLTKCIRTIFVKGFHLKKLVLGDFFNQKVRASTSLCRRFCYFDRLGVINDSHATNKSAPGGVGALGGSSPFFSLVAGGSYMTPSGTFFYSHPG